MDQKKLDQQSVQWEINFSNKPEMFGLEPSVSAIKALEIFKEKMKIKRYLDLLQKTSVTNMFGASPYLYIGEDILRKEHYNEDSEEFEELCDMADEVKSIMIQGAMKILEKENKEINVETVGRKIKLWAPKVLNFWMTHY